MPRLGDGPGHSQTRENQYDYCDPMRRDMHIMRSQCNSHDKDQKTCDI